MSARASTWFVWSGPLSGPLFTSLVIGLVVLVGATAVARADPLDLRPIEVKDKRIKPGSAQAEDTAFSTTVDANRAATEGGGVAEHLARSVGVQVRRSGSHGDFSSVLIRGSSANQVGIFLDGIPLALGRGGLFDLSLVPLLSIARIDVFRGYLPAEFGSEGIGGAINLVPGGAPKRPRTRFLAGVGAFDLVRVGAARSARHGPFRYAVNLGFSRATNDFGFFSDNDTPYQLGDDNWLRRKNNQSLLFSTLGWARWQVSRDLRVSFLESFSFKDKGLPGAGAVQSLRTRYRALHQVFDVKVEHRRFLVDSLSAMARVNFQVSQDHFTDPQGEMPMGAQDQRDTNLTVGAIGRLSWAPHDPQIISLIPEWRYEQYVGYDPGRSLPSARRYRFGLALRDRVVLWSDRVSLTPVVRLDLLYSDVTGLRDGLEQLRNSFHWFASPRLGARVRVVKGVELRGNFGRYFRPPSLLELFGNRGTAIGNPDLEPEVGTSGDVGVTVNLVRRKKTLERVLVEAAFFGRDSVDLIQWVQNSQRTAVAMNISRAVTLGGELSAGMWLRLHAQVQARLTANYTLLHTQNRSGKPLLDGNRLPGRPLHELNGRVDLVWRKDRWGVGVHWSLSHISDSYLDEANSFLAVPRRTLHEVGLVVQPWLRGVSVSATFKNVANLRVEHSPAPAFTGLDRLPRALMDYGGFPLPGWEFYVNVTWAFDDPDRQSPQRSVIHAKPRP
jgi:outer membrane cobalamin receptor